MAISDEVLNRLNLMMLNLQILLTDPISGWDRIDHIVAVLNEVIICLIQHT